MTLQQGSQKIISSKSTADNILRIALDIGEGLLKSGGDVRRVEYTIEKICKAYGAAHVEVFCINFVIEASVRMADGEYSNQIRRIIDISYHLGSLEEYNNLSRHLCEKTPSFNEIDKRIKEIKKKRKYPLALTTLGNALGAGSFAVFFGGNFTDAVISAVIAVVIALLGTVEFEYFNKMLHTLMMSFVASLLSCIIVATGVPCNLDMVNIGTIMTLVPGVYLGNAMRDLLCGDTLSGSVKTVQSFITVIMMAIGYAVPIFLFDGIAL